MSAHDEVKARQRRMWTVGDFPDIAKEGRWSRARAELAELVKAENQASDGSVLLEPEYLLTVIELPG